MKNVLIISYFFPPYSHSGVQRPLKFAKYLPEFGYHPIILTCNNMRWDAYDHATYESEVRDKIETHGTNAPHFDSIGASIISRKLFGKILLKLEALLLEDRLDWAMGNLDSGLKLVRDKQVEMILSTGPPQSVHFLGYYLKTKTGIPWIMDFRDPFVLPSAACAAAKKREHLLHEFKKKTLFKLYENAWVKKADGVINVTPPITQAFKNLHPTQSHKMTTITNGYDDADFRDVVAHKCSKNAFTLLYTGRLSLSRNPHAFLQGLRIALEKRPVLRTELEVVFIGQFSEDHMRALTSPDIDTVVRCLGPMDHHDVISHLLGSDVNLLLIPANAPDESMCMPGKMFEYLRTGKPILVLAPDGVAREFIDNNGIGFSVHPEDCAGIAEALLKLHVAWRDNKLDTLRVPETLLAQYNRRNLTKTLAGLFDDCLRTHTQP